MCLPVSVVCLCMVQCRFRFWYLCQRLSSRPVLAPNGCSFIKPPVSTIESLALKWLDELVSFEAVKRVCGGKSPPPPLVKSKIGSREDYGETVFELKKMQKYDSQSQVGKTLPLTKSNLLYLQMWMCRWPRALVHRYLLHHNCHQSVCY